MQQFFDHCELLRRTNYCTKYCDGKQLLQRHPLRNPPLLRTPKTKLFCGRKRPVWDPLFDPEIPPEKVYVGPFFASFQETRHINFFLTGQDGVFWVGVKKFMLKKFMCFFGPLLELDIVT